MARKSYKGLVWRARNGYRWHRRYCEILKLAAAETEIVPVSVIRSTVFDKRLGCRACKVILPFYFPPKDVESATERKRLIDAFEALSDEEKCALLEDAKAITTPSPAELAAGLGTDEGSSEESDGDQDSSGADTAEVHAPFFTNAPKAAPSTGFQHGTNHEDLKCATPRRARPPHVCL